MAAKVLVVEDEQQVLDLLADWLTEAGYVPFKAANAAEGMKILFDQRPDLVVADVRMPQTDGFEFCKRIREVSNVPIMILSALGNQSHKVKGLDIGADEYVVKPIQMEEFHARVAALLRRAKIGQTPTPESRYMDPMLDIDAQRHEVHVLGNLLDVTPTEFRLLLYLCQRGGKVVSVRELLKEVWGSTQYDPAVVKWHISSLRRKIEEDAKNPKYLVTVWGTGYRYDPPA